MKISIIGAGNVGSLTAMRIAQEGLGDVILVDIVKGLAQAKALDLEDARPILKSNYNIQGGEDTGLIKDSDIIIITAGLTRKPGMAREGLLHKNAAILKEVCQNIKKLSPKSIIITVTNPLDLLTFFCLKVTGFEPQKVIGMGSSLDNARFANLISSELMIPNSDIESYVIASHGQDMLPLPRFTKVKGVQLDEFTEDKKIEALVNKTIGRGAEIVSLLGSGSAYFAPSAAITEIVRAITKDTKQVIAVCAYLNGEYGIKDACIGVPCRLGKSGIEGIVELELNAQEKKALLESASMFKQQYKNLPL